MVIYAKIRRMYFREHLNISEIKRRTSLSRNTYRFKQSSATAKEQNKSREKVKRSAQTEEEEPF